MGRWCVARNLYTTLTFALPCPLYITLIYPNIWNPGGEEERWEEGGGGRLGAGLALFGKTQIHPGWGKC